MKKQSTIITVIAAFLLLWVSSEAFSTEGYYDKWGVPSWMNPWADPSPVYKYGWAFGTGSAQAGADGQWYDTSLSANAGKSGGDGTAFTSEQQNYWTSISGQLNGFSLSNDIGSWLVGVSASHTQCVIRYSIRQDYSSTGGVDNSDIVELFPNGNERVIKKGTTQGGAYNTLGLPQSTNVTALEGSCSTLLDDERLVYDHVNSIGGASYDPMVSVARNQDDENVYLTFGATAEIDEEDNLTGSNRFDLPWGSPGGNAWNTAASENRAHHADVCYEKRTYNPRLNADGPESPYEWLYDASDDMWVPTDGSGLPGDTPLERARKLIGCHPHWVDDDTAGECEADDYDIWRNKTTGFGSREGVVAVGVFVDAWRLAGYMLGDTFWNSGYVWDSVDGRVEDGAGVAQAGYYEVNNFMRYVFDIDALVVDDADGDGEFDYGDDYVLFSVVDDGLYDKYEEWGGGGDIDTPFGGEFFDGDTIFLYDGSSVTTYFDAEAGIFFGNSISTSFGSTLWSWGSDVYDLDALDIAIAPEPGTLLLLAPALLGFAGVVLKRRK